VTYKKGGYYVLGAGVSTDVHEIILKHWSIEKRRDRIKSSCIIIRYINVTLQYI
jgi:hypothetical protein